MADNHSSKAPDLISDLPDELLVHILEKLCYCHFNKVSQVSKRFNILLKDVDLTEKMKNKMSRNHKMIGSSRNADHTLAKISHQVYIILTVNY